MLIGLRIASLALLGGAASLAWAADVEASAGAAASAANPGRAVVPAPPLPTSPAKMATPAEIVAAAPAAQWVPIAPEDLLVMELPPRETAVASEPAVAGVIVPGPEVPPSPAVTASAVAPALAVVAPAMRRVVIQLIAPPYSQGWAGNIRVLAAQHWWDGLAIVRVQDNYVVQWGDPDGENAALARPLPPGLQKMPSQDYVSGKPGDCGRFADICPPDGLKYFTSSDLRDAYADSAGFVAGWPVALQGARSWPVHCYGSVGVGRDVAPDTGSGAELYVVIGQSPRQLDRNIAVVGRVIEGIENLSSLPRGTAELGFYATPAERTPIATIRPGTEVEGLARYEYLSTNGESFARYVHARANRKDDFYIQPAGSVDVCNVPVPVRKVAAPAPAAKKKSARK